MNDEKQIELNDDERATIEAARKLASDIKACAKEVQAILDKYGLDFQVVGQPQVALVPRARR